MARFLLLALMSLSATLASSASHPATAAEIVEFRCEKWKARHEHNKKQADQIVETLTKLKCEVTRAGHNGHEDIKYRCKDWKSHSMKSHEEAHKLEAWLKALGFETKHKH